MKSIFLRAFVLKLLVLLVVSLAFANIVKTQVTTEGNITGAIINEHELLEDGNNSAKLNRFRSSPFQMEKLSKNALKPMMSDSKYVTN
jgi:hypothetical protein